MAKKQNAKSKLKEQQDLIVAYLRDCITESDAAKQKRRDINDRNWSMYNGEVPVLKDKNGKERKQKGQARINLQKVSIATEQLVASFKQGLMNFNQWLAVEPRPGYQDNTGVITATVAKRLLGAYIEAANLRISVGDALKFALHESRATIKVRGCYKKRFFKEDPYWALEYEVLKFQDYHLDPHGDLYQIHETLCDYHKILQFASDKPNKKMPYSKEAVMSIVGGTDRTDGDEEEQKRQTEGHTNIIKNSHRRQIEIHEFWGTVLDRDGTILEYTNSNGDTFPLENVMFTVANRNVLIQEPQENPRWSGTAPFITSTILRLANDKWPKAVMDSGVNLNVHENELYALMIDGAKRAVHNVSQIRTNYLEDPKQVADGVPAGTTLRVTTSLPVGAKVMETVSTGAVPVEAMQMKSDLAKEFAEHSLKNQAQFGGIANRSVLATELVQANQSIQGLFSSLSADIDDLFIERLAEESWLEILQNANKIPGDLIRSAFDGHELEDAAKKFTEMTPKQRFDAAGDIFKFKGKGIFSLATNQQKAQALTSLLSVAGQNPLMLEAIKEQVSIPKAFMLLAKGLGIDIEEIKLSQEEVKMRRKMQEIQQQALADAAQQEQGQQARGGGNAINPENAPSQPEGIEAGNGQGAI